MVKRRPPSPPPSPTHTLPAGRCIKRRRLRLPSGIIPYVRKLWSRLAAAILPSRIRALTQATTPPRPAALRMRAESFQLAGHGRTQDCHFIHGPTIGVADGVGGYRMIGIDAGEYAEDLMMNALAAVVHALAGGEGVDPIGIMQQAHSETTKRGGSTACIITLTGNELRFANVGDSGFKVFRGNAVAYESPIQELAFNTPAKLCAGREAPAELAVEGRVGVEVGDFVVAGTDGLFDNLHTWEIQRILESREFGFDGNEELARTIALTAYRNSIDPKYFSPFEADSLKHGLPFRGGKSDDITVVVGRIKSLPPDDSNSSQPLPSTLNKVLLWAACKTQLIIRAAAGDLVPTCFG